MDQFNQYLQFRKEIAEANLRIINRYLSGVKSKTIKRTSNINIVKNVLLNVERPLHISEIIKIAMRDFNTVLERDSIVSGIIKKVKAGKTFVRTAPNTFALKEYTTKGNRKKEVLS